MSQVKVTFLYDPDPEEADEDHESGLTSEAYDKLVDNLMMLGAQDVEANKV